MLEALANLFSLSFTQRTYCKVVTLTNTTYDNLATLTGLSESTKIKCLEIKNKSGITINVKPNNTDAFVLEDGENRLVYLTSFKEIELARNAGSGSVTVYIIWEN